MGSILSVSLNPALLSAVGHLLISKSRCRHSTRFHAFCVCHARSHKQHFMPGLYIKLALWSHQFLLFIFFAHFCCCFCVFCLLFFRFLFGAACMLCKRHDHIQFVFECAPRNRPYSKAYAYAHISCRCATFKFKASERK